MTEDRKERTGTVLIVDDDPDYLAQMEFQFSSRGYRVLTADNRKDAEDILAAERPDFAILDLMMENTDDGFMLSYSLKKRYPDVPVVLVTAVTSETGYEFSEKLSASTWIRADSILSKPVRFEQVLGEIDRLAKMADQVPGRRFRVLVADDEEGMRLAVERALRDFTVTLDDTGETIGMDVVLVDSGEAAIAEIESSKPDIVLLDNKMGGMSGLDVLTWLEERDIDLLAVMITAYASIETAISATRKGAYDFLPKPFTPGELRVSLRQAVTHLAAIRKTRELEGEKRRVRFQFISVLAHELKAPLGAIEGYLYVLQDKNAVSDPAVYDRIVDRCQIRLVGMRKLIYDLLDLTRLESGSHKRELVECDLKDAVTTSIETMTPDADRRGISILREAPDGPVALRADSSELGIILNNLISNAVKYNRDGGSITVRLQDLPDQVVIAVSDTGIGMSEEELGKLFQEFTRIRNAKTKDILGSGLGLTILQKLATLYGGTVTVESTPDVGSTFTVNLMKTTAAV